MRTFTGGTFVAVTILALSGLAPSTAAADPVADFYRGKSISMIIATAPGGDYDLRARLVARHMGRHIPGNPTIVPRNMPGGVGIQAANYMANVAPQDGTVAARHHAEHVDATRRSAAPASSSTPASSSGSATPPTRPTSSTPGTPPASARSRT